MTTLYKISKFYSAYIHEDNYNEGQSLKPLSYDTFTFDELFITNSMDNVLKFICKYLQADLSNITINSCDEYGRVDVSYTVSNVNTNSRPSKKTLEKFQNNELNLYTKDFTFYILVSHDGGFLYEQEKLKHPKYDADGYFIHLSNEVEKNV